MKKLIFIIFLILVSISQSYAKNLFVATDGNNSTSYANNDINNPWLTPGKAWEEALAGDNVYFRVGTYTIASNIDTNSLGSANGTSGSPITFQAYSEELVTFSSSLTEVFTLQREYNYVSDIIFTGTAITWFALGEDSSADYFKVTDCTATMSSTTGGDNVGFVKCRSGADNVTIDSCTVVGPGLGGGIHLNTACIYVGNADNVTIKNCELSGAPIGIYLKFYGTGGTISYNYITDTSRYSIFNNLNSATFEHNIIGDNNARVRFSESNGGEGGDNNTWNHNTILEDDFNLNKDEGGGADNNDLTNNIIYSYTIDAGSDGNTWDYNLQVTSATIGVNDISGSPTYTGGASPSTIAGFALTSESNGYQACADSSDMGADVSLVGTGVEAESTANITGTSFAGSVFH